MPLSASACSVGSSTDHPRPYVVGLPLHVQVQPAGLIEQFLKECLASLAKGYTEPVALDEEFLSLEGLGQVVVEAIKDHLDSGLEPAALAAVQAEGKGAVRLVEVVDVDPVIRSGLTSDSSLQ